jgi:glutaredoxin
MVKIYSTTWCPSCRSAKRLFDELKVSYEEINIEEEGMSREELAEITTGTTVPQIVINDECIGGYDNLLTLYQGGQLKELLSK